MLKYKAEIIRIETEVFKSSFDELETSYRNVLIEEDNELIGYLLYNFVLDEAEIISIYVKDKYRKLGYATKLINRLKEKYNNIFLEVNEHNLSAYNLYLKTGFETYLVRNKYYDNKDNAYCMKWSR